MKGRITTMKRKTLPTRLIISNNCCQVPQGLAFTFDLNFSKWEAEICFFCQSTSSLCWRWGRLEGPLLSPPCLLFAHQRVLETKTFPASAAEKHSSGNNIIFITIFYFVRYFSCKIFLLNIDLVMSCLSRRKGLRT